MTELERVPLGRTGIEVARLGYGSLNLGGRGTRAGVIVPRAVARRVLDAVLGSGINLIDTAPDYGDAEEVIGRCISGRRDEYVIASKCGCPVGALGALPPPPSGPRKHDYSPHNVRAGVEQSLTRLRTDYLDVVQVHESPPQESMEAEGTMEELLRLKHQGKVRFLGISSTLPHVQGHLASGFFDVVQLPYSIFQPEYQEIVRDAAATGAGVIVRGALAQGSVAGVPDEALPHRREQAHQHSDLWEAAALDELLDGMSRMELMLRFVLAQPAVSAAIVGTADTDHLAANVRAARQGPLPASVREEVRRRLENAKTLAQGSRAGR